MNNTALAEEELQEETECSPRGHAWAEVRPLLYTPEKMAECDLKVAIIGEFIKARREKGYSQRELAELSGVKQPIIARMEKGNTSPQLGTVLKVLFAMGKTLCIKNLPKPKTTAPKK